MAAHTLSIEDRGRTNPGRFVASCSCGWRGIPRRRLKGAATLHHEHRDSVARRGSGPARRLVTPEWKLPEALRVGA